MLRRIFRNERFLLGLSLDDGQSSYHFVFASFSPNDIYLGWPVGVTSVFFGV